MGPALPGESMRYRSGHRKKTDLAPVLAPLHQDRL